MPRHKAFETAAARRRRDPIIWNIDGRDVVLVASIDFADWAALVSAVNADTPEGSDPFTASVAKRQNLIDLIAGTFVEADFVDAWREAARDIDMRMLGEMCSDLIAEYAGTANPTEPSSSTPGSEGTGQSSTDGAQPEA